MNDLTKNCLDVAWAVAIPNQDVNHFHCKSVDQNLNQRFLVKAIPRTPGSPANYNVALVSTQNSSLCLDLRGGTANGGEHLQLFPCHDGLDQQFQLPRDIPACGSQPAKPAHGRILVADGQLTGKTLVLHVALPTSLAYVEQFPWNSDPSSNANQQWTFYEGSTGEQL